LLSSC